MATRLELQAELEQFIGNNNVYFQPPESIKLAYPCIIYRLGSGNAKYADNGLYKFTNSYDILFISKSPRVDIVEQMLRQFPMCRFSRHYNSDNLNHYAFTLYY